MTADQVRRELAKAAEHYGSKKLLAEEIGVSPAFLGDIINGNRAPSGKPVEWLGLVRHVIYVRKTIP